MMGDKEHLAVLNGEVSFHNERYGVDSGKRKEDGFYRALYQLEKDFEAACNDSYHKDILDYGCGIGDRSIEFARRFAANITGIDISDVAIRIANERAEKTGAIVNFVVADCEDTSLESQSFDLILGTGILHHLDLVKSLKEIDRLARPRARIVFYEPLGTNPLINLYRRFTPQSRSADEHPLLPSDLKKIVAIFPSVSFKFYGFLTVALIPFFNDPRESFLYRVASAIDNFLFKLGPVKWFAWSVLIVASK